MREIGEYKAVGWTSEKISRDYQSKQTCLVLTQILDVYPGHVLTSEDHKITTSYKQDVKYEFYALLTYLHKRLTDFDLKFGWHNEIKIKIVIA